MSAVAVSLLIAVLSSAALAQGPVASHAPASPATAGAAPSPAVVIARVNGVALTQADLLIQEQAIFPYYRFHGGKIPASAEPEIRQRSLHRMVLDELLYQEARRRKLTVSEAQVQKGLRDLRGRFHTPQAYRAAVTQQYGSVAAFERRVRRNLLARQLWDAEVKRKSAVTDAELRTYYENNKARFVRPEAVSLQSISVLFPQDANEEQKQKARKRAEALLPKARAAKNYEEFGVLAEQVSEDPWRVMMGDHKWVHRGEVDPQFEPIFAMKPGAISAVVESREGFHILRVNEQQPQRQMTLAEMRDRLRKQLEKSRRDQRAEQFERQLRKNAKIEMLG